MPRAPGNSNETATAARTSLLRIELSRADAEIVAGPDAQHAIAITASGIVVGTSEASDLQLTDGLVSRRHLELQTLPKGVRVRDLGSRNGTYIGGMRIVEVVLEQDATLTIGNTSLAIKLGTEPEEIALSARDRFGDAIGTSIPMRHVFSLLEQAAKSNVTILLEGDSGTGKDVLAASIHKESARADGPFVVVDCGSIPEHLVESELFGHERGAFTGAISQRIGAFEQADGGTIFLDEIGELPLEMQPKLLRALEARTCKRVGGSQSVKFDVRVMAATNRRLREAVRHGDFREDLLYRLAVVHVHVPRLRDRPEDIVPLAEHFLRRATGDPKSVLPEDLTQLMSSYDWPGNARELRNVIDRFVTFQRVDPKILFGERDAEPSSDLVLDLTPMSTLPYHEAKRDLVDAFHRIVLPRVVERAGSVPRAAEILELPRTSLYRMLKQVRGDVDE